MHSAGVVHRDLVIRQLRYSQLFPLTVGIITGKFLGERDAFAFRQALHKSERLIQQSCSSHSPDVRQSTYVFAGNGFNHVGWRSPEQLSDDGKLIDICNET